MLDQPSTHLSPTQRIESLLTQLKLHEKITLLAGSGEWFTGGVERLGIPRLHVTDGPHGARGGVGRDVEPRATSFPTGVSMGASWNPALIEQVGIALAEETLAENCDILLGPCVNIVRTPLGGRNFETYGEDPYLNGQIGAAWVRGLQSRGVGASLKHYACNNQEFERTRNSSELDERTLREIYLPAFETIVKETQPWTVMCAYNRISGVYASQNRHLLQEILRDEWGFEGVVMSDWGAVHSTIEAVEAGLDLEMPGPSTLRGDQLWGMVYNWLISESAVDACARRVLGLALKTGRMDGPRPAGALNTPEHQALARQLADESITLLKNDGILPLDTGSIRSIAVIGPNANECRYGGGGSSFFYPPYAISPLAGLQARLGESVALHFAPGCDNFHTPPSLPPAWLTPSQGEGRGLWGEYFNNLDCSGPPAAAMCEDDFDIWTVKLPPGIAPMNFSVRWTGSLAVPYTGRYQLTLRTVAGACRLFVGDMLLADCEIDPDSAPMWPNGSAQAQITLQQGQAYPIRIEYAKRPGCDMRLIHCRFAYAPEPADDVRIPQAVELARQCDIAIIFGGMPFGYEAEGNDRPHMDLPGSQNALIEAVRQANPNTIVVLNTGAPVTMPWLAHVPAVVQAYYGGQELGHAVAAILLGEVNPSGKLTVSYPRRYEDNPTFLHYPGLREVRYGEGLFVGYRYYDTAKVEPLFPFGHGLSYTSFEYTHLHITQPTDPAQPVEVSLMVTNSGHRTGQEVVQLYVHDVQSSLIRPEQELKGFAKLRLEPGESQVATFYLDRRSFALFDPVANDWVVEPGSFEIRLGASSRDIRLRATIKEIC
jgi:beta-glucosidase